jgi:hypothetical protein
MFPNLKRSLKRLILFVFILGVIALAVMTFVNMGGAKLFDHSTEKVVIDTDCGYTPDDLFALTRALHAPELEIIAITSSHCNFHPDAGDSSLSVTVRVLNEFMASSKQTDIPIIPGAQTRLTQRDYLVPAGSPAANAIIKAAHQMKKGKKLAVVALGSLTNIAAAIRVDSTIIPKLKVYASGFRYTSKNRVWNKNEFNVRNDLDAADILLNSLSLEMHILPANVASEYTFFKSEISSRFYNRGGQWDYILGRWERNFPSDEQIGMNSLALVQCLINPDLAREEPALTPPENSPRQVYAYTRKNKEMMDADFWATVYKAWKNSK